MLFSIVSDPRNTLRLSNVIDSDVIRSDVIGRSITSGEPLEGVVSSGSVVQ